MLDNRKRAGVLPRIMPTMWMPSRMIYYICPKNHRHINWAPGDESAPRACGWPGCDGVLVYHPIYQYVFQKAQMYRAIDLKPVERSLVIGEPVFGGSSPKLKRKDKEEDEQPLLPSSPQVLVPMSSQERLQQKPVSLPEPLEPVKEKEVEEPSKKSKVEVMSSEVVKVEEGEFGGLLFKPVIVERQSQAEMYRVFEEKGYTFLCRDGKFRKYKEPTRLMLADEIVPEPGVVSGGYCTHKQNKGCIMGRDDSPFDKTYYGKGMISYPDFVVCKSAIVFSIELKTPREGSFATYLSKHFYDEKVFSSGRSVVDELDARRGLTDKSVEICLLFDVRNVTITDDAITDLKNSIKHNSMRKTWWSKNVNGVLFYLKSGLTKRFTIVEILSGESMDNSKQQMSLKSFFKPK